MDVSGAQAYGAIKGLRAPTWPEECATLAMMWLLAMTLRIAGSHQSGSRRAKRGPQSSAHRLGEDHARPTSLEHDQ
jgi:hypothetical protein